MRWNWSRSGPNWVSKNSGEADRVGPIWGRPRRYMLAERRRVGRLRTEVHVCLMKLQPLRTAPTVCPWFGGGCRDSGLRSCRRLLGHWPETAFAAAPENRELAYRAQAQNLSTALLLMNST